MKNILKMLDELDYSISAQVSTGDASAYECGVKAIETEMTWQLGRTVAAHLFEKPDIRIEKTREQGSFCFRVKFYVFTEQELVDFLQDIVPKLIQPRVTK
jgi:hypothetical protein